MDNNYKQEAIKQTKNTIEQEEEKGLQQVNHIFIAVRSSLLHVR